MELVAKRVERSSGLTCGAHRLSITHKFSPDSCTERDVSEGDVRLTETSADSTGSK